MVGAATLLTAGATLATAPPVSLGSGPYQVALPEGGRGFVRVEILAPGTILVFTRNRREATRLIAPLRSPIPGASLSADEACGGESSGVRLGFGGSDEYCGDEVREHRWFDAHRLGWYFVELTSPDAAVRLWLTRGDGHRFEHIDDHAHHH